MTQFFLITWTAAAGVMTAAWLRQRRTLNAGIVDVLWTAGLGLAAVFAAIRRDAWPPRVGLVAALAFLWSARLTMHLAQRVLGEPEDGRYAAMRRDYGDRFNAWMFLFYQVQALLVALLALSFWVAMSSPEPAWRAVDVAAVVLWTVSIGGESIADRQLAAWRANPANRGRTCRAGLWRYSRHPNYFFEWLHWLVYPLIAHDAPWSFVPIRHRRADAVPRAASHRNPPDRKARRRKSRRRLPRLPKNHERLLSWPDPGEYIESLHDMNTATQLVDRGLVPQPVVRWGIRRLLRQRLREQREIFEPSREAAIERWTEAMRAAPVALHTREANEQHYEVEAEFFEHVLGPHLKYSSCYFEPDTKTLEEAEARMLELTMERAGLTEGMDVLELGCGWGSLSLAMAARFPNSRFTGVSNSASQRDFIMSRARERGLSRTSRSSRAT